NDPKMLRSFVSTLQPADTQSQTLDACKNLAKADETGEWVVARVLMYQTRYWESSKSETERQLAAMDVAIMIENLREDAGYPVMLAMITLLDDGTKARFGIEETSKITVESGTTIEGSKIARDGYTKPLKELAHNWLVSRLGVDCGYDSQAWSREI